MSEGDWDSVTRIGSNVRKNAGGGAAGPKVIRGAGALNAANRMGGVTAEKKYGGANQMANTGGQRLTKVDRENDIIKPAEVNKDIGKKMAEVRQLIPLTQKELAVKCSVEVSDITKFENGSKLKSEPNFDKALAAIERVMNLSLRGQTFGQPKNKKMNNGNKWWETKERLEKEKEEKAKADKIKKDEEAAAAKAAAEAEAAGEEAAKDEE